MTTRGRVSARKAGLRVMDIDKAVRESEVMMMLVPDVPIMAEVYRKYVAPYIRPGSYLGFAHGFNIHYRQIVPDKWINVFMVAPKGPGHLVRNEYLRGAGVPCLIAVHNDPSGDTRDIALAYASGIGAGRAGIIETTFKDETETDLFGEQAVLCGA
jgi:ketol-acid reductoisomerase